MLLRKNLTALREAAFAAIDAAAERQRLVYITGGAGQAMVYQQKRAEALAVLSDAEIDVVLVPHVAGEATAAGVTIAAKAAEILAMADLWTQASAAIEVGRMTAKAAVRAATTPAAIDAAVAAFTEAP